MTPDSIIAIGQNALVMLVLAMAPLLIPALVVGLAIGVFQAATQINEMTLSFIPKILALVVALFATGPWLLNALVNYTRKLIEDIPFLIG